MGEAPSIPLLARTRCCFGLLWGASGVSNLADGVGLTAAPLLAVALTRDPLLVSGLTIAQRLPWFLFTLISGAFVDRLDRRVVMARSNLWRFALLSILALTVLTGRVRLVILYVVFFLLGTIETLFDNAALAILPQVVEEEELERANGRLFATATLTNELIGPPLGSYLFSVLRSMSFFLASMAYGLSSLLIHRLPGEYSSHNGQPQGLLVEIKEGVRWYWHHRLLRALGFFAATFNLVYAATMGVFVLFAQDVLGLNEAAYGFLLAFGAVGGILGSLLAKRLTDRFGAGRVLFLDAMLSGLAFIGIGLTTQPAVVGLMFVFISMSDMLGNVIIISLRQAIIPPHLLGRVASAYRLVVLGALPLGALIGGVLARTANLAAPFLAGGALLALAGIAMQPAINNRTIRSARKNANP
jgi:predicted MFS family arabinose efflux permease